MCAYTAVTGKEKNKPVQGTNIRPRAGKSLHDPNQWESTRAKYKEGSLNLCECWLTPLAGFGGLGRRTVTEQARELQSANKIGSHKADIENAVRHQFPSPI